MSKAFESEVGDYALVGPVDLDCSTSVGMMIRDEATGLRHAKRIKYRGIKTRDCAVEECKEYLLSWLRAQRG